MAITTANNSSNSHYSRRPCRNRRRTTSTGSSDSGRSYLALKLVAIIGILCCAVRNVLSPTTMNLKQWTMLVSPIITAPPPPTTTITKIEELTKELEEGLIADVYRQVEDKEETTGTSASASATRTKNLQCYVYDDIVMRMPEFVTRHESIASRGYGNENGGGGSPIMHEEKSVGLKHSNSIPCGRPMPRRPPFLWFQFRSVPRIFGITTDHHHSKETIRLMRLTRHPIARLWHSGIFLITHYFDVFRNVM